METDDIILISDCLSGNDEALSTLIERYARPVFNFANHMIDDTSDAEDIAQETFFKMWKNLRKFRAGESFKTWLFAIARNTTIDHIRKRKDVVFSEFDDAEGNSITDALTDPEPLPDELLARIENAKLVGKLLSTLSLASREVLLLYYTENLTFNEIAKVLGKSIDTVKSQHRRALIHLRKILNSEDYNNAPKT